MDNCPVVLCGGSFLRLSSLVYHLGDIHNWNDKDFGKWLEPYIRLSHVGTAEGSPIGHLRERKITSLPLREVGDLLDLPMTSLLGGVGENTPSPKENERLSLVCSLRKEGPEALTENGGGGRG